MRYLYQRPHRRSTFSTVPINEYDVQSLIFKKGLKSSDNEFHHHQKPLNIHWYSLKVIDALADQICSESDYLKYARDAHAAHLKKRSKR